MRFLLPASCSLSMLLLCSSPTHGLISNGFLIVSPFEQKAISIVAGLCVTSLVMLLYKKPAPWNQPIIKRWLPSAAALSAGLASWFCVAYFLGGYTERARIQNIEDAIASANEFLKSFTSQRSLNQDSPQAIACRGAQKNFSYEANPLIGAQKFICSMLKKLRSEQVLLTAIDERRTECNKAAKTVWPQTLPGRESPPLDEQIERATLPLLEEELSTVIETAQKTWVNLQLSDQAEEPGPKSTDAKRRRYSEGDADGSPIIISLPPTGVGQRRHYSCAFPNGDDTRLHSPSDQRSQPDSPF
jgi:hypothetical protein